MSDIVLPEFRLNSILPDQVDRINCRLVLLNTKPGRASTYLVLAAPENAKTQRSSRMVERVWPEVVLGIMVETEGDGNQTDGTVKSWNLHPTRKDGAGWRKKKIEMVRGRDFAARCLLGWWAEQNDHRLNPERDSK
jgi:hypothetical protein